MSIDSNNEGGLVGWEQKREENTMTKVKIKGQEENN